MKKRMIGWLLALVMAATLLPVQALAAGVEQPGELRWRMTRQDPVTGEFITTVVDAENAPEETAIAAYAADTYNYNESVPRYGYNALAQMEKGAALVKLYDGLLASAKLYDGTNTVRMVSAVGLGADITEDDIKLVVLTLRNDHPEMFWVKSSWGWGVGADEDVCTAAYLVFYEYDTPVEETKRIFVDAAEKLLAGVPQDGSNYIKEKYLHDALAGHITYDSAYVWDQGAYTAMVEGRAVCAGYATSFQYLLQCVGIESFVVTGWAGGGSHAWNIVKLEDDWHFVDVTWDDGSTVGHAYFNRGSDYMSGSHTIDEAVNVPIGTLYDYVTVRYEDYDDDYHQVIDIDGSTTLGIHLYTDSWTVVSKVSCLVDGVKQRSCVKCGHVQEVRTAAPGQHTAIFWFVCGDYEIECECRSCGATWNQSQFANTVLDDGTVAVGGFWGDQEDIVIPRQLNGLPVTRITQDDSYPFYRNSELKTVTLPNTVTTLSANAFADCAALEMIVIPASVTTIEKKVFSGCDNLKDIYYLGGQQQWVAISKDYVGNAPLNRPATTIHCIPAGDLNGNGTRAEATDLQCLYTYLTSGVITGALAQREGVFRAAADLNGDGSVDVYDLQRLYETASGLDQAA